MNIYKHNKYRSIFCGISIENRISYDKKSKIYSAHDYT